MTTRVTRTPEELESLLRQAAEEFTAVQTVEDVRVWWRKHYLVLGHKKLGRLLLGKSVDSLVEQSKRRAEIE